MDSSAEVKSLTWLAWFAESASKHCLPPEVLGGVGSTTSAIALSASSVHDQGASDVCSAAGAKNALPGSAASAARCLAAAGVTTALGEPIWATTSRREPCTASATSDSEPM